MACNVAALTSIRAPISVSSLEYSPACPKHHLRHFFLVPMCHSLTMGTWGGEVFSSSGSHVGYFRTYTYASLSKSYKVRAKLYVVRGFKTKLLFFFFSLLFFCSCVTGWLKCAGPTARLKLQSLFFLIGSGLGISIDTDKAKKANNYY